MGGNMPAPGGPKGGMPGGPPKGGIPGGTMPGGGNMPGGIPARYTTAAKDRVLLVPASRLRRLEALNVSFLVQINLGIVRYLLRYAKRTRQLSCVS
jgi:hypothetical protein